MAQKIPDFKITDFSGGVVRNKSDREMNRNELKTLLNFDVDNRGRLKTRRGYRLFGTTLAVNLVNGFTYLSGSPVPSTKVFLVFDSGTNSNCYSLITTSLTSTLSPGDTSMVVTASGGFAAATSTIECEGDILTYTAKPDATHFTVTTNTILKQHLVGISVNQWSAAVASGINSTSGIYGALLNSLLYVCGIAGGATTAAGASFADIATSPNGLFATNYRDRIYVIGSGTANSGSHVNGDPVRVSFSNAGTAATWTSTDFFDVEDAEREMGTALHVLNDRLLIFKLNSIFTYDEVQLKKRVADVGAYNHESVQEIDDLIYTFSPTGIHVTNGFSSKRISDPVEDYVNGFIPQYDATNNRVITNCFSAKYGKKYILYLSDIRIPSQDPPFEEITDATLVYDTVKKNWTVYTGIQDLTIMMSVSSFIAGDKWQGREAVFVSPASAGLFRAFDSGELGIQGNPRGGDILANAINNSAGTPISALAETPFMDLGFDGWWKRIPNIRVLVEQGNFNVSYRLDKGDKLTDWKSLGNFKPYNQRATLSDNDGFRIAFKVTSNQSANKGIFNGIIIEDAEAITKQGRT